MDRSTEARTLADVDGGAETFARLTDRLDRALEALVPRSGPVSLLFSGGVDSSLLASRLRDRPGLELVAVGLPGSPDLVWAPRAAARLGLSVRLAPLSPEQLLPALERHADELSGLREPARSVGLTTALAIAHCRTSPVVLGQGADELFLGYARYRTLGEAVARREAALDLERLVDTDWPRTLRIARSLGREAVAPYLEPGFRSAALHAAGGWPYSGEVSKPLLRAWSSAVGLPEEIAGRPKSAMQYGTRVRSLLGRLDRTRPVSPG